MVCGVKPPMKRRCAGTCDLVSNADAAAATSRSTFVRSRTMGPREAGGILFES